MTPGQSASALATLEEQRQGTLMTIWYTQHTLVESPVPEATVFARIVRLLEVALKCTSVAELQAVQQEAEAPRPALRRGGAEVGTISPE